MAIYHYSVGIISRSKGRSATAAAAYRAAEKIEDIRTGDIHDYRKKKGVDEKFILAPVQAPNWVYNRQKLWNEVELGERRKDSQLSREINVAIPVELSKVQQVELVKEFVQKEFVNEGMVADVAFHNLSSHNPHAHIMLTMREIEPDGFSKTKQTAWNRRELLEKQREAWAVHTNRALELAGINEKIDHRSNEAQGINEIPQIHLGANVNAMMKRGIATERGERWRAIAEANKNIRHCEFQLGLVDKMESIYRNSPELDPTFKSPAERTVSVEDIEPTQPTPPVVEELSELRPDSLKLREIPRLSEFESDFSSICVTPQQFDYVKATAMKFLCLINSLDWDGSKYRMKTNHRDFLVIEAKDNRGEILRIERGKVLTNRLIVEDVERFTALDARLKIDVQKAILRKSETIDQQEEELEL